jgi:hypothetical protein
VWKEWWCRGGGEELFGCGGNFAGKSDFSAQAPLGDLTTSLPFPRLQLHFFLSFGGLEEIARRFSLCRDKAS